MAECFFWLALSLAENLHEYITRVPYIGICTLSLIIAFGNEQQNICTAEIMELMPHNAAHDDHKHVI